MRNALFSVGSQLVREFHTRDPFEIADGLGIQLHYCDISPLKGMYRIIRKVRFIFIDEALPDEMQRIVCAHEIGHDQLHRHLADGGGMQEMMLYDMHNGTEYEANMVAAEILLDDQEITDYVINYGYTTDQIARAMHTDVNLVALKISAMAERGVCFFNRQDYRSDFLR